MGKASKRRCGRCDHRDRDHSQRGCLVCFKCAEYVPKRASEPECVCSHTALEHENGSGHCKACRCRYYLLNLVLASRIKANARGARTSVRIVPGGASESNRRRH